MHNDMQMDVAHFMTACEQKVWQTPLAVQSDTASLYLNLIEEEYKELLKGVAEEDIIQIADGIGDLIWVILGLANTHGINITPVWEEIRASNMSKTVDGNVIRRADGKILKPDTYFPPNIAKALGLGDSQ
jgi:predicted HAD superfamily Cof-like phosphohydrolase